MKNTLHHSVKKGISEKLSLHKRRQNSLEGFRKAGVLLLLYERYGEIYVLFTLRSHQVKDHKGQISFPGGAKDPSDRSLLETAIRETYEEIGLKVDKKEILGKLDDLPTPSQFIITPFVAWINLPTKIDFNTIEITEVFEAPLRLFYETELRSERVAEINNVKVVLKFCGFESIEIEELVERFQHNTNISRLFSVVETRDLEVYFYKYQVETNRFYNIWGVTARIMKNFVDIVGSVLLTDKEIRGEGDKVTR